MTEAETLELLGRLAASEDKVQVWARLAPAADSFPLEAEGRPMLAADALVGVRAAASTARSLGHDPSFTVRRWEP
jgi:hypothetical protein